MSQRRRRFTGLCDDDRYFLALLELKCALAIVELAAMQRRNIQTTEDRISSLAIDAMQQISIQGINDTIKDLAKASDKYRDVSISQFGAPPMTAHIKRFEAA